MPSSTSCALSAFFFLRLVLRLEVGETHSIASCWACSTASCCASSTVSSSADCCSSSFAAVSVSSPRSSVAFSVSVSSTRSSVDVSYSTPSDWARSAGGLCWRLLPANVDRLLLWCLLLPPTGKPDPFLRFVDRLRLCLTACCSCSSGCRPSSLTLAGAAVSRSFVLPRVILGSSTTGGTCYVRHLYLHPRVRPVHSPWWCIWCVGNRHTVEETTTTPEPSFA